MQSILCLSKRTLSVSYFHWITQTQYKVILKQSHCNPALSEQSVMVYLCQNFNCLILEGVHPWWAYWRSIEERIDP